MAENSTIEWTDATWNPITGCAVVSPGCTNCYAMKLAGTRLRQLPSRTGLTVETKAGPVWNGQVRLNAEWLTQPLLWRRPRKIFVCAHGDLFAEGVPDGWIDRVFAVMALAPHHTFQVLTKRSARMQTYLTQERRHAVSAQSSALADAKVGIFKARAAVNASGVSLSHTADPLRHRWPLPNVWLGVSAEDQRRADERVPNLLDTPAAVRFVSAEPLLGPINLRSIDLEGGDEEVLPLGAGYLDRLEQGEVEGPRLDWIIVGGESGPGARPMHPDWARFLRDQCAAAGVAFHFKQHGAWAPDARGTDWMILDKEGDLDVPDDRWPDQAAGEVAVTRVGKKAAGRLLDGRTHDAMPETSHAD